MHAWLPAVRPGAPQHPLAFCRRRVLNRKLLINLMVYKNAAANAGLSVTRVTSNDAPVTFKRSKPGDLGNFTAD